MCWRFGILRIKLLHNVRRFLRRIFKAAVGIAQTCSLIHDSLQAAEMPAQVSFDVPKNATGAYNYWITRCERAVRVMNRRPHFIWLDIQSYFGLSDAEMESYFGPCPEIAAEYQ